MSSPVWPMLAAERSALVAYLPTLSAADWGRPTPCPAYSVRDQVAHILAGAKTTPLTFGPSLARSGFSFDKLGARGIRQQGKASPKELTDGLRARISAKTVPGLAYLGEVFVHGEDIRRGVGAPPGDHPAAHQVAVADYYQKSGGPVHGKRRTEGLKLTASDIDWTTGSGPEVRGPLVLLIMAICGRGFALEGLTGPGIDELVSRLG
jgi:uncharacterized protein (TIGR03083 family)